MNISPTDIDKNEALATLLFGEEDLQSIEDLEKFYPPRKTEGMVTRLGPSPTGFIHLGNLYMAYINQKFANQTGGAFYLRVEDTDKKRSVDGAVETLISELEKFGISFDEGVQLTGDGREVEMGSYGPYCQSDRREIYRTFAASLVKKGLAYPCFLTAEEIEEIRLSQEQAKLTPGIYGEFSKYRDADMQTILSLLADKKPYVLRLRADETACFQEGQRPKMLSFFDEIRGELNLPQNFLDIVLLKNDGLPTYHFAHVIDDCLMRTSTVIRGEEWLSSLPIHVNLYQVLGLKPPAYAHATVLMKLDDETGKKRKLSKRKDKELSLSYYRSEGYFREAMEEYFLTIINSNYEEWRIANPHTDASEFSISFDKMSHSGILFDLDKLKDISKDVLLRMGAEKIARRMLEWAREFKSEAYEVLEEDEMRLAKILDIGRSGDKPRKDLAYASQIWEHIRYFYPQFFEVEDEIPANISKGDVAILLGEYAFSHSMTDDRDTWFEKIRDLSEKNGYAKKPKDYKKNPELFKGHVGNVSALIRLALVGRTNSPDIYEIEQIMGEDEILSRLENFTRICKQLATGN